MGRPYQNNGVVRVRVIYGSLSRLLIIYPRHPCAVSDPEIFDQIPNMVDKYCMVSLLIAILYYATSLLFILSLCNAAKGN
jgi:hypothetical protein